MSNLVQDLETFEDLSPSKKSQSLTEMLKTTLTNISYNIKNSQFVSMPFITRKTIQIVQKDYAMGNLLGKSYSFNQKEDFQQRFNNTIWMSYRIVNDQGDVGWGCMIRVVQMVFAEVFQRYFSKANVADIIKLFKEQTNGPFSLAKICKKGRIEKRFTSSPQIYSIMSSLVKQKQQQLNMGLSIQNYCSTVEIKSQQDYSKNQFPKLISISTKVGEQGQTNFSEDYFNHLLSVIKDSNFCGIAAGIANEALFIVGQYKQLAIILDPHYVQNEEKEESYFQKIPKGIQFTKLKSSFTINFYFEDIEAFGQWVDNVMLMQKVWSPYLCFNSSIKNPEGWIKNHRKKSQDFQMLI